ncbi:MAG: aldo/keto reductase [Candidatus Sericytochromatia bacterium]|nr:aldo/keto reductase [Candidatus Sericytochromatia bacterium]
MKRIAIPTGEELPIVGQGCSGIGEDERAESARSKEQIYALELGIDLGMTLLDTAEGYASGHSEEIVGQVIRGKRDKVFIATKFSPENHEFPGVIRAAEGSLRRLKTEYIDLYQIHWPNPTVPIEETLRALEHLRDQGKIRHIGLSNFSAREMHVAQSKLLRGQIFSNQVEYNLFDRFIETSIMPHCLSTDALVLAYSPLDKGRTVDGDDGRQLLSTLAEKYQRTPSQIALNWLTSQPSVIAIPKAVRVEHVRQNAASTDFKLSQEDKEAIAQVCSREPAWIDPGHIRVSLAGEGNKKVYQTREEALSNTLGLSPSPTELAEFIRQGEPTKPVRLVKNDDPRDEFPYDLIEGRLRYWAWVIAFNGERPVPAYIRMGKK